MLKKLQLVLHLAMLWKIQTNTDTTVKVYKIAVKVDGKDIKTLTFKVKVVDGGTVGAEIKDEVKTADTVVKADDADL